MKGFTLWFTGLPCSGKSTLAQKVEEILLERGMKVEVLDGDVVRTNLSKGLGYSKEDRDINIRRIGFVCHLLTRNDVVAIAAEKATHGRPNDKPKPKRSADDAQSTRSALFIGHVCDVGAC